MSPLRRSASRSSLENKASPQQRTDAKGESKNLQTPEEVARYLNVNKFTIYRLVTQNKIPGFKVGNQWRFRQEMIDDWLMSKLNVRKKK